MLSCFNWLFPCRASDDDVGSPPNAQHRDENTISAPTRRERPAKAAPSKGSAAPSDEVVRQIPLEFVNPETEVPEEVAMKGRRQSTGTLLNPATIVGADRNWPPEEYSRPPSHAGSQASSGSGIRSDATGDVVDAQYSQSPTGLSFTQRHQSLLGSQSRGNAGRKCLVLDLDETLVHSSFKALDYADFIIRVEIEGVVHDVYVVKRPGIDEFLAAVSQIYEVVVFTASVAKYGDPLLDRLDPEHRVHHRLFRESCYNYNGNYIKDLAQLGRPLEDVIIIDNSPGSYALQPHNAVPVSSWFSDMHDNELLDMLPLLQDLSGPLVPDVSVVLQASW